LFTDTLTASVAPKWKYTVQLFAVFFGIMLLNVKYCSNVHAQQSALIAKRSIKLLGYPSSASKV